MLALMDRVCEGRRETERETRGRGRGGAVLEVWWASQGGGTRRVKVEGLWLLWGWVVSGAIR